MKKLVALLVALAFGSMACYNTYHISMDQMKELQAAEGSNKVMATKEGEQVEVSSGTRLFVRDVDNRRYPITPYNFKLTGSQLVASDRDYIFMLSQIRPEGEVDLLSTPKTVLLIAGGAGAVAGLIVVTILTAGQKSFSSGE
ncbi:MAG: hypothetical protein FJ109_19855 [Deltaproteobacteria bacterium]|nr:hypothetical protein [Deltaproteobacteria bacterium]